MANLEENSDWGGLVSVTIPNPAADISPSSQPCRSCMIRHFSGTATFVNINAAAVAATSWPLGTGITIIPVRNLNQLHFIGTAEDVVQIMWRD